VRATCQAGHELLAYGDGKRLRSAPEPIPWLLAGVAMFCGGIVAHARRA
jgi:hypothetical protein